MDPSAALESGDNVAARSPPGAARSRSGAVPHSVGPTSSPRKWPQSRRSQLPRDGEVLLRSARCLTPLDPPAALESGNTVADRSPPGTAKSRS
eukprot:3565912-Pyramimonas_sp.AAC.1